jgi:hypothetical protein
MKLHQGLSQPHHLSSQKKSLWPKKKTEIRKMMKKWTSPQIKMMLNKTKRLKRKRVIKTMKKWMSPDQNN